MPHYEYECTSCGNTFEVFQQISEPSLAECLKCKKKSLRRLFGKNVNILFKGSGFYATDYRSEEYKKREKEEKEKIKPKKDSSQKEKEKKDKAPTENSTPSSSD